MFDVSGAGDTVIATLAVMLASGAEMADAVRIANRAAGIVVGKLGTAVVSREEILEDMERRMNNMYYVVTGAAGFIGSNLVKALNERGETNIIAVDNLKKADKFKNLTDCEIADYIDKEDFVGLLQDGSFDGILAAVLHEGACSDTMETDGHYMMENNYRYSLEILNHCQNEEVPFLYASSASVYGGGGVFKESREYESPLNVYAYSKFLFDQVVRRRWANRTSQIVGFRYFNVYGQREHTRDAWLRWPTTSSTSTAPTAR